MLILLRLVEDVVTFQTIPAQRRKDIQHALTQNMMQLFSFLLDILQEHTQNYKQLVNAAFLFTAAKLAK